MCSFLFLSLSPAVTVFALERQCFVFGCIHPVLFSTSGFQAQHRYFPDSFHCAVLGYGVYYKIQLLTVIQFLSQEKLVFYL